MSNVWEGDWHERAAQTARALGYRSVHDFASAHCGESYDQLVNRLSNCVAPIQLKLILKQEAEEFGSMRMFAADALSRFLTERLPDGWTAQASTEYAKVEAIADWITLIGEEYEAQCSRVWDWLKTANVPTGWLPKGPEDELLREAFTIAWPADGLQAQGKR